MLRDCPDCEDVPLLADLPGRWRTAACLAKQGNRAAQVRNATTALEALAASYASAWKASVDADNLNVAEMSAAFRTGDLNAYRDAEAKQVAQLTTFQQSISSLPFLPSYETDVRSMLDAAAQGLTSSEVGAGATSLYVYGQSATALLQAGSAANPC